MKNKIQYHTIGIIANTTKENVNLVVSELIKKLQKNNFHFLLSNSLLKQKKFIAKEIKNSSFVSDDKLCKNSDHDNFNRG
ncbi:MAG: hypothetical protein MZV64_62080 [Ignavibacteriales bacterium]|nr:hypothetical protein [Ignavibacteriales bacterium]